MQPQHNEHVLDHPLILQHSSIISKESKLHGYSGRKISITKTLSERWRKGIHCSTGHVGGGEVKNRGREENEDSSCYSIKRGSKAEIKIRRRHHITSHVGGVEVKKKGGEEEEGKRLLQSQKRKQKGQQTHQLLMHQRRK